jgi:hypothetical protein
MSDDQFDAHVGGLLDRDASWVPGAPSSQDMVERLRSTTGSAYAFRGRVDGAPALRAILVLALIAALVGAVLAVGAWVNDRGLVVAPSASVAPSLTASPPTPPWSPRPPIADRCAGWTLPSDIRDTSQAGNAVPRWISAPPPNAPRTSTLGELAVVVAGERSPSSRAIRLIDSSTGSSCVLVELPDGSDVQGLGWSPSGDALAIEINSPNLGGVLVWSAAGGITRADADLPGIDWAPDGSALLASGADVYLIPADGSARRTFVCEIRPGQSPHFAGGDPTTPHYCAVIPQVFWSPDSTRIAVSGGDRFPPAFFSVASLTDPLMRHLDTGLPEDPGVWGWLDAENLLAANGPQLLRVPIADPGAYQVVGSDPELGIRTELSPDLSSLAASSFEIGADLVVTDLATGRTRTVVRTPELGKGLAIHWLTWAPNGRSLAFTVTNDSLMYTADGADARRLLPGLWVVNLDGTGLRQVSPIQLHGWRDFIAWRPAWQ